MKVRTDHIEQMGGVEEMQARVEAFKRAIEAHKGTTGLPAPAETAIIETLARLGEAIEPVEPPLVAGSPQDTFTAIGAMNHAVVTLTNRVIALEHRMDAAGK